MLVVNSTNEMQRERDAQICDARIAYWKARYLDPRFNPDETKANALEAGHCAAAIRARHMIT